MENTIAGTRSVGEKVIVPATLTVPELTYHVDGTRVARKGHPEICGRAAGMTVDAVPHEFQVVKWDNGKTTHTAPHVLVKIEEPLTA